MTPLYGRTRRWLLLLGILGGTAACRDTVAPRVLTPPNPSAIIVDGAHNGGNDDVFFLPPLVPDPSGATGYGDPEQLGLPVEIQVNCLTKVASSSCPNFDYLPNQVKASSDAHYMVNWDTKAAGVDPGDVYRIEVHIGQKTIAWADVAVVTNGNPKNVATQGDIPLPDGRTMPIKVRIEQGWDCTNRTNKSQCVTQVVPNAAVDGSGSTIVQFAGTDAEPAGGGRFYDGWIPYSDNCQPKSTTCVPTGTPVVVTIEDQTSLLNGSGATCGLKDPQTGQPVTTMLTQLGTPDSPHPGRCVKFTTNPKFQFANRVDVAVCVEAPTPTQQLLKYDIGETPQFLQNVFFPIICEPSTVGSTTRTRSSNRVIDYALNSLARAGRAMTQFFTPKSAYAIHLGVGGLIPPGGGFSYVAPAEPYTMSKVSGDAQTGTVGTAVAGPQARITSVHPSLAPAVGQKVSCEITGGAGHLGSPTGPTSAVVPTQAITNDAGAVVDAIATCPAWYLGAEAGTNNNTLRMVALNIDDGITAAEDDGEGGVLTDVLHGVVTFTATATANNNALLFGVNSSDDALSFVNSSNGAASIIGRLGAAFTTPISLASNPTTGVLYAYDNTTGSLLTVDKCTGAATQVNSDAVQQGTFNAIAFRSDGTLFGVRQIPAQLQKLDITTGFAIDNPDIPADQAKPLTLNTAPVAPRGLAFGPDGTLYTMTPNAQGADTLLTINISTGVMTPLFRLNPSPTGLPQALAFDPNGIMYGTTLSQFFNINPTTGAVSNVNTPAGIPPQGMAFSPPSAACIG